MHLDLIEQSRALATRERGKPKQASLRRATSAVYYALFHLLSGEASRRVLPRGLKRLGPRLARAVTHENVRRTAVAIASGGTIPLLGSVSIPSGLDLFARLVLDLHEMRQFADYDLTRRFTRGEVLGFIERAEEAIAVWRSARSTDAGKLYLLLLLVYGNLRDRS